MGTNWGVTKVDEKVDAIVEEKKDEKVDINMCAKVV